MTNKREIFAKNLRKVVEKSYMNQSQLASKIGVSRGTMSDYLSANAYPRPERMELLCSVLGVTEYDLTTDFEGDQVSAYMTRDVAEIAQELFENPDARALYSAITKLKTEDMIAVKQIVMNLSK